MIEVDKRLAMGAAGGAVIGLLLSLAVTAPSRATGDAMARQHAEALMALTSGVEAVEGRIGAMDAALAGIETKAREIDVMVEALGAAFSIGDPKLVALYERLAGLEAALATGEAVLHLPASYLEAAAD